MISRVWHGWTTRANADAYEKLLREEILPGIHRVRGFKGAHVLRRELRELKDRGPKDKDEVEFVTITQFDSLDTVKEFAGEDYEVAVILPEAHRLLVRFDARSTHYETVLQLD
jgi:heme-degrading monooxygenase HmoA